jgi:stearoyl-CoA desaturase (delta-9 desaturase)
MSRTARNANLLAVIIPFVAFLGAIVLLWNRAVGPLDLGILAVMYLVAGVGVTVGFHRLLTHRAFETHRALKYVLAVLGSLSVQGPVITWVADHRKHHAHTDEEGDPHSPHVGHGSGLRGLLHAHMGWLMTNMGRAQRRRYAPELMEDPGMRAINRSFELIVVAGLAIPFALGYLIGGTLTAALTALLWGGLVRIFLLHHITWSINSVCHFFGRRRFATDDHSTNVFWLALPSLGESWHHNHHAFPRAAQQGLRSWELDPSGALIGLLERLGLAWNVVRITPERQRQREAPGSARIAA